MIFSPPKSPAGLEITIFLIFVNWTLIRRTAASRVPPIPPSRTVNTEEAGRAAALPPPLVLGRSVNPIPTRRVEKLCPSHWAAKQQISWVIAPWWIFIPFLWPSSSLALPEPSSQLERHLHFASIKLCQASWMWYRFCG